MKKKKFPRDIFRKDKHRFRRKITLPLYFGWEIEVILQRVKDWRTQLAGPFKKYWQYISLVGLAVVLLGAFLIIRSDKLTKAATYSWVQTLWSASSTNTALHPGSQSGWGEYYQKDPNLVDGSGLSMSTTTASTIQTTDADFNAGAKNGTRVTGLGEGADVTLATISLIKPPTLLGGNEFGGYSQDVFLKDNYAYVAARTQGLKVLDIASSTNPSVVGQYFPPGWCLSVYIVGDRAYIADNSLGLSILDISNPTNPSFLGSYDATSTVLGVFVSGNYAYLATSDSGLIIVDISVPATPLFVGVVDTPRTAQNSFVVGNYAYVADYDGGLQVVDITDKANPSIVASVGTTRAYDVFVYNDKAYVADEGGGLRIVDVSNPLNPQITGSYITEGDAFGVYVSGNYAFIADNTKGLQIIDVSSSTAPALAGNYDTSGNSYGVYIQSGFAYIADYAKGLQIIDVSFISSLRRIGDINTAGTANESYVEGNYAYLADHDSGLKLINISNPSIPFEDGSYDTPGNALGVSVKNNYAYVADDSGGLQVVNISVPTAPISAGSLSTSGYAKNIFISGDFAYVAAATSGLDIIDISNPANPTLAGNYDTPDDAMDVYVVGDTAYIADSESGLIIVDVSVPSAPGYLGTYDTLGSANGVFVSGNYAYIADMSKGISIINITDPANPTLIGSYDTTGISYDVFVQGTNAFLADGNSGLQVVDVTNPSIPSLGGTFDTGGNAYGVFVSDRFAYISDGSEGLQVILTAEYADEGTYASSILDTVNISYLDVDWTMTLQASTTFSIKARSSQSADMAAAPDWSACDNLTDGQNLADSNCVNDMDRYLQYRLDMSTNDNIYSPVFSDIEISYVVYPYYQSLVSSPYDTDDPMNIVSKIGWTENAQLPSNSGIIMYLRASSSEALLLGTSWQEIASSSSIGFLTPGCTRTNGAVSCLNSVIPSVLADEVGDQWIQYKVALTTLGSTTPDFYDVSIEYVVNMHPEFDPDYPGAGDGGVSASQGSDGLVTVIYSVRDPDASLGTFSPYFITPSLEYSLDNGLSWQPVDAGLSSGATTSKAVEETAYTPYSLTWNPKQQIDGQYSTTTMIKVIANDIEGANNTASSVSAIFELDTKDPIETLNMRVVATTSPALLHFSVSDDTPLAMMVSLDPAFGGAGWEAYSPTSTIALATDPETVYARFRDSKNNHIDLSATTPEAPINAIIRDISNVNAGDYRLFVAWKTVAIPLPQFSAYNVYYSTDGEYYAPLTRITDRSINYFLHFGLNNTDTFYYKISAEDADGNYSHYSHPIVSDVPDGSGGDDNTPPVISSVAVSTTSTQQAGIVWDTDEPSNSVVEYGIAPSSFTATTAVISMKDNASGLGIHSVTLTGLAASTTYYYRVFSTDANGNTASADNGGPGYSFTTQSGPVISGVAAPAVTNSGATIEWNTDLADNSYVVYSLNADLSAPTETGRDESVTAHTVSLAGLISGTDYYYYVRSGIATDDNGGNYYSFRTASDITPPLITGISASLITDMAASISWTTDEKATSRVEYGTASGAYPLNGDNTGLNTDHTINLSGLTSNTAYYYRVISADSSGNSRTSAEQAFTTREKLYTESEVQAREDAAQAQTSGGGGVLFVEKIVEKIIDKADKTAPIISGIKAAGIDAATVEVSWTTDEDSDSFVEYGINGIFDNTIGRRDPVTAHKVSLTHLSPSTKYGFRVTSSDASGNLSSSASASFTTSGSYTGDADKDRLITSLQTQIDSLRAVSRPDQTKAGVVQTAAQAFQSAVELLRRSAGDMSSGLLESTLFSQYSSLEEIAGLLPGPNIEGDPKVVITSESASVTWTTNKDADSFVAFVPADKYDPKKSDPYTQVVGKPTDKTKNHEVFIYDLKPDTTYHYQVRSKAAIGATKHSKDYTFKTSEEKLEIRDVNVSNVSHQEAIFKWLTTKQTDSQIKYIPYHNNVLAVDQAKIKSEKTMTTMHELDIDDFEAGVAYSIEISGKDETGESVSKTLEAFTTSEDSFPPEISTVQTETALSQGKDLKVQAVVTWITNEPATSKVYYEEGVSQSDIFKQETKMDPTYAKKHIVVITAFEPGAIYRYKVESIDSSGNKSFSKTYTILTPRQKESVFQMIMKNIEETFGWMGKLNK